MGSRLISNTLSILAGASLGSIATYLLDPDQGDNRRKQIADSAESAVSGTGSMVHAHLHRAAESAKTIAEKLGQYAHAAGEHVSDHIGHAADHVTAQARSVGDAIRSVPDRAQSIGDGLSDRANSLYLRGKKSAYKQAGVSPSHPVAYAAGTTIGAVGVLALGAGAMYFFDPDRGHGRRAWAQDKILSWSNRTKKSAASYGRHLGNKARGVAHDVQSAIPPQVKEGIQQAAESVSNGAGNT